MPERIHSEHIPRPAASTEGQSVTDVPPAAADAPAGDLKEAAPAVAGPTAAATAGDEEQHTDLAAATHPVTQAVTLAAAGLLERPLAPGLHLVATPIGHLGDMTLRAIATLAQADRIYCEDTRHSARLLAHFAIRRPVLPYHDHNAAEMRPRVLADLAAGARIALISDAGTPLVSDPGYKLVRAALAAGHPVLAVPGASAVLASLAVAGLPTDSFLFAGFLPPKAVRRHERLVALLALDHTVVLFEAPSRVAATLEEIAAIDPERPVVVARELTKLHETIARDSARRLSLEFAATGDLKGECVVLVGPATEAGVVADTDILTDLAAALAMAPLSAAVKSVALRRGVSRSRVYDLALSLQRSRTP